MIHLNFNHLNGEKQEELLNLARKHAEQLFGDSIKHSHQKESEEYENSIHEEAIKLLYTYRYSFKI